MSSLPRLLFSLAMMAFAAAVAHGGQAARNGGAAPAPSGGGSGGGRGMGDLLSENFPFHTLRARSMDYDARTSTMRLTGNAVVIGADLSLECEQITADAKRLVARGNPAKIKMNDVDAECRDFTYDIEKKTSRLEGNPRIIQRTATQMTTVRADVITLIQNENGQVSWSLETLPGSTTVPEITRREVGRSPAAGTGATTTTRPAERVGANNLDRIPTPAITD